MLDKTNRESTNLDDYESGTRKYHAVGVHNFFHNSDIHSPTIHAMIDGLSDEDLHELFEAFCSGETFQATVEHRRRNSN
jgi:hypothetical protein